MAEAQQFPKFVFLIFVFFSLIVLAAGDGKVHDKEEKEHGPNAAERAIGFTTHVGSRGWSRIKSWVNHAWLNFWPPDSKEELEVPFSGGSGGGAGEVGKKAASKSFETSKTAAEKAAKSAGEAVKKTVEKVKRSVSNHGEDSAQEL